MQQNITLSCEAFEKNPDGSWISTHVTDIQSPVGAIRIGPGLQFNKDRPIWGIDVVRLLEETCEK
jgi:hypothetical protein